MNTYRICIAAAAALAFGGLRAEPVYTADFAAATQVAGIGSPIAMAGVAQPGVAASLLTPGSGVLFFRLDLVNTAGTGTPLVFATGSVGDNAASTMEEALSVGSYYEFTLSTDRQFSLTGISFKMVKHGFTPLGAITLRSSADNYAADIVTVSNDIIQGVYPASAELNMANIDQVTFRFYAYDLYVGNNNRRLGIDDIVVTGTVSGGSPVGAWEAIFGDLVYSGIGQYTIAAGWGTLQAVTGTWWDHSSIGQVAVDPTSSGNWVYAAEAGWLHVAPTAGAWLFSADHGWLYHVPSSVAGVFYESAANRWIQLQAGQAVAFPAATE
jgi:hypothetical protein